jgi:hypothetical protein
MGGRQATFNASRHRDIVVGDSDNCITSACLSSKQSTLDLTSLRCQNLFRGIGQPRAPG